MTEDYSDLKWVIKNLWELNSEYDMYLLIPYIHNILFEKYKLATPLSFSTDLEQIVLRYRYKLRFLYKKLCDIIFPVNWISLRDDDNDITNMIMNDNIDAMRDYLLQNDKLPNTMYFSILYFGNGLEASCRMGAVNIFYYLRSHPRYSFIPITVSYTHLTLPTTERV